MRHPILTKVYLCVLKGFLNTTTSVEGKILFSIKDIILQICVKFCPINSENEDLTSYYKVWCT